MDKQIEIGGKKLMFGRVGVYEHIKTATGQDPLEWLGKMYDLFTKKEDGNWHALLPMEQFTAFAYAGLNLYADINDEAEISMEKTKRWVRTLSIEECWKVINSAVESMISKTETVGELTNQPVS